MYAVFGILGKAVIKNKYRRPTIRRITITEPRRQILILQSSHTYQYIYVSSLTNTVLLAFLDYIFRSCHYLI